MTYNIRGSFYNRVCCFWGLLVSTLMHFLRAVGQYTEVLEICMKTADTRFNDSCNNTLHVSTFVVERLEWSLRPRGHPVTSSAHLPSLNDALSPGLRTRRCELNHEYVKTAIGKGTTDDHAIRLSSSLYAPSNQTSTPPKIPQCMTLL